MATIHRYYIPDPASDRNTDLMVYEAGSYVTKFTYAYERVSQTTSHYPNKTEPGMEGQNPSTDIAVNDIGKVYVHTYKNGSTAYTTDNRGRVRHYADY